MDEMIKTEGGGRVLQALARRYAAVRLETHRRWCVLRDDLRNEELIRSYVRGLRRCGMLQGELERATKGGAL